MHVVQRCGVRAAAENAMVSLLGRAKRDTAFSEDGL